MAYRESALEMEDIDHASPSRDDLDGDGFVQTLHPLLRPGVHNRDIRSKIIQSIIKNTIFPSHNKMVPSLPKEAHTTPDQGTGELALMVQSEPMRNPSSASHTYIFNLRKMKEDVSQYTTAHQDPTVAEVKSAPSDGKSAVQMTAGSLPVGGRGRKKAKHAEYKVPVKQVPNLSWRLAPAIKAAPSVSCSMFYDKLPHMWAEDEEDVISAIQTHPDIFKAGGIGTEGSCLNYLVLSGTGWQDIEWVSPYVMLVRRKLTQTNTFRSWKFKKVGTKRPRPTRTETPNPRKRVRFDSKPLEENTLSETLTPDSHTRRTLIEKEKKGNSHLPKQQQHDEYPSNIAHKSDVEMSFGSAKKHVHTFTEGPPTLQGLTSSVTLDERHDKTNEVLIYKPRTHNTPQLNHTCDIPDENNLAEFYNHSYGLQDPMATSLNNSSQIVTPPLQPIAPEIPTYSLQRESWSVGSGDAAVLPEESQYFQTALETRHPVVIFARNDSPFARSSPSTLWTYAFMGFFVVADFRIHSTVENEDTGTTQLYITFKWVGNGSLCNQPNPYPWWISEEPTSENSMDFLSDISDRDRAMCSSLTCFTHIALYPKSEESLNEDDTTECNDDFFENLSCWLCTHCGKLNAIIPFRLRWSWTCRYCKNVGRSTEDMNFRPVIFREAYHLPPPLPVESAISPTTHSVQFFKALERAIVYRFKLSNILLQHIPSTDEDTQKAYESLYCTIQQRIDFMPCDTEHSLLRFDYPSPQIAQTDITFLLTAFHTFIKDRPKLTDDPNCMVEPHGIQCAFWPSKGISKTQPFKANRHVLFIALGSTCDLTFSIKRIKTEKKKNDTLTLVMPHGSMLFFHHHDESTVTYKVARTDKLLLLTCYWDDVQDENIMANTSNITSNTLLSADCDFVTSTTYSPARTLAAQCVEVPSRMPPKKTKTSKKKHSETNGSSKPKPVADSAAESTETPSNEPSQTTNDLNDIEMDPIAEADRLKERGNESFKAKRYGEAIDFYTRAIELRPAEPTYFTNRAACSMALKMFRPALADCQAAANLQSSSPSPKTLVRLAKCHLALGSPNPALSAVREAMAIDSGNSAVKDVELAALRLEAHLSRCLTARSNRQWGLARLALDQAARECEGSEPIEWRCWRIEIELARGKLEQAMLAANEAFQLDRLSPEVLSLRGLVMFLSSKLPSALQHLQQALSLDPENTRARKLLRRIKDVERTKEEGNVSFKSGDMTGAIGKYTEALVVVGEEEEEARGGAIRATLLSNRATALLKIGRRDEALADTETSLTLVPTSYKALRTRARINMAMEDYQAAVRDFKASMEQVRADGSQAEERALKQELKEAEIALKRSKTKDYYKILDVSKTCTDIEIKKAYRKQSLLHHPDKGGDEEKFKLASEAYNVLSDPQKRSRYDAGEDDSETSGGMGGMNEADLADIFASFGGGGFTFGSGHGGSRYHTTSGFSF